MHDPARSSTRDAKRSFVSLHVFMNHRMWQLLSTFLKPQNPQRSHIAVYVMNLEDLVGYLIPLVHTHRLDRQMSTKSTSKADEMINAFRHYQQKCRGRTIVQCFTATAPYATMHDEICLMAFEKSTSLVIIPLQDLNSPYTKTAVKKVLKMAPCSVGVMFDRWTFMDPRSIFSLRFIINVCVVFVGGPDDLEALAYGARMTWNHIIMLTVIRLIALNHIPSDLAEEANDFNVLNDFRMSTMQSKNVTYMERNVKEGCETETFLNSIGNDFDLMLVGRRHETDSSVSEWSEFEELGVVGDLLVSSDFKGAASVLVMQQQASVVDGMVGNTKNNSKQVEMKIGLV